MKVGITIWEGRVSPLFDTATRLLVVDMRRGKKGDRFEADLEEDGLGGRCRLVQSAKVKLLICGAISKAYFHLLSASGVKVIPWISGRVEDVLDAYVGGRLLTPQFLVGRCRLNDGTELCGLPPDPDEGSDPKGS